MSLDNLIRRVAEETFEALAFMLPMPAEGDPPAEAPTVTASVRFAGPVDGMLLLTVEQAMLGELAGNMLGVMDPDELTADQQHDGLKELLNVICGNLLPEWAGQAAVFDVLAPDILADGRIHADTDTAPVTAHLQLDTGRATVTLIAPAGALRPA